YISALASIGILVSAYLFKLPTDNLKDGFNSVKRVVQNRIGNSGNATNTTSPSSTLTEPTTIVTDEENITPVL
ncbi:MAG TPA: hypothetical protein VFU62_00655, partial [Hanamia sp.]|nr:hypothetical protein [Hanamia sp.]